MKEDFLHYLWKFKNFDTTNLKTTKGEQITIVNSGDYLKLAGPDFFNGRLVIGNQKWAGNIEIHLQSSDWYAHKHESDPAYENVILHVVWEHDTEIYRKNNTEIAVLELREYVSDGVLERYNELGAAKSWIFCERQLKEVDQFVVNNWIDRLFFERLERKSKPFTELLELTAHDWEAALFCFIAKNFGLNTNGEVFLKISSAIPFSVIRKEMENPLALEALLFGMAGLLEGEKEDIYFKDQKSQYTFLAHKYNLSKEFLDEVQFFKHRPDNFPTIRLSQLTQLYAHVPCLFSKIIEAQSKEDYYQIFKVGVSEYWQTHYQFDRESTRKHKMLTHSFIDLLIVNTVIPVKFAYAKSNGRDIAEHLIATMTAIPSEKNVIIEKFAQFGIKSDSALQSQALLELKNEYCNKGRCLQCAIGISLLKSTTQKNVVTLNI